MKKVSFKQGKELELEDTRCHKCDNVAWLIIRFPPEDVHPSAMWGFTENKPFQICAYCKEARLVGTTIAIPMPQATNLKMLQLEYENADDADKIRIMAMILGGKDE